MAAIAGSKRVIPSSLGDVLKEIRTAREKAAALRVQSATLRQTASMLRQERKLPRTVLLLDEEQTDVLRFILDETIERWEDQSEEQLKNVARDPALTTLDQELEVFQFLANLPCLVRQIRKKLD